MNFLYGLITGAFLVAPALIVLAYLLFGREANDGWTPVAPLRPVELPLYPDLNEQEKMALYPLTTVEGYHVDPSS